MPSNRFQHPERTHTGDFHGQQRLAPGNRNKCLPGKVVNFIGLNLLHSAIKGSLVSKIGLNIIDPTGRGDVTLAIRARKVAGRKTRTLHKNREECGTPILGMDAFARTQVFIEQALTPAGGWSPGKFPHHTAFRVLEMVSLL